MLLTITCLAGCNPYIASNTRASPETAPGAQPVEIIVEHDFGMIGGARELTNRFKIHNHSDHVWTIEEVETSCSCMVAEKTTKKTIEPYADGFIDVTYYSPAVAGPIKRDLLVKIAEPDAPVIRLVVRAHVRATGTVSRSKIDIRTSQMNVDKVITEELILMTDDVAVHSITLKEAIPWLECAYIATEVPGQYQLACTIHPGEARLGNNIGYIEIYGHSPDSSIEDELLSSVRIALTVSADLDAIPDRLFYGRIAPHSTTTKQLFLRFFDAKLRDLHLIEQLEIKHQLGDQLLINVEKEGSEWKLRATFSPNQDGIVSEMISVTAPWISEPLLIPLSAIVASMARPAHETTDVPAQ
jgi:hypothetical protein